MQFYGSHKRVSYIKKKKLNYSCFRQIQHSNQIFKTRFLFQKSSYHTTPSVEGGIVWNLFNNVIIPPLNHHLIISRIERDSERELVPRTRFLLSRSDSLVRGKSIIYYTSNFVSWLSTITKLSSGLANGTLNGKSRWTSLGNATSSKFSYPIVYTYGNTLWTPYTC